MKINFKKLLLISSAILFFSAGLFFAHSASAATLDLGLQPLEATGLGHADIRIIIANIIKAALGLLGILALGLMLYAGYEWMTSGGNDEQIGTAKKILINATIGLVIILSAYSIVAFVMTKLVEATTGVGIDPKCKAQIAANPLLTCGGDCPPCDNCLGNDCGSGASLLIKQKPLGGDVCVQNFHPIIGFNKAVDVDTVQSRIKIVDPATLKSVVGKWNYLSDEKSIAFYPEIANTGCADGSFCFLPNAKYQLQFKNTSEILSKDGKILDCGFGNKDCGAIDFTTGAKVDQENPKINIIVPNNNDSLEKGKTVAVKVNFTDDSGIQNINLNVDGNFINSVLASPGNNCSTSGQAIVNWPTDKFNLGTHIINVFALDWATNKGQDSKTVSLKPAHCFDEKIDIDLGEKFLNCGGECGVCEGDKCYNDIDCTSGYCEIKNGLPKDGKNEGVCIEKMRIDDFSPESAAVGDYFSIFGKYFGSNLGHVYFSGTKNGEWVEAQVVNCANGFKNWTNNQIIVSVTTTIAQTGPIKVETASTTGKDGVERKFVDTTNDSWGPKPGLLSLGNFVLSNISHPGLCLVDPNNGPVGANVKVYGKGFGLVQEADDNLKFQDSKAAIINWSESLVNTAVPSGLDNGDFSIRVKKKDVYSNGIKFTVSGFDPNGPIITGLSTNQAVKSDYLVIYGKNFGKKSGSVFFKLNGLNDQANTFLGANNFPSFCADSVWNDNKVIIKIPTEIKTLGQNYTVQVKSVDTNTVSPLDNTISVKVIAGIASPGICKISPPSGPVPFAGDSYLYIYGENFSAGGVSVYFWKDGAVMPANSADFKNVYKTFAEVAVSKVVNEGDGQKLSVQPSADVKTGALFLYNSFIDKPSNPGYFSVFDCTKNKNTCVDANDQCCSVGTQNGLCIPKKDTCAGTKHSAGYVWLFSTGGIAPVPQVVERCNADTDDGKFIPSPSPSTIWNSAGSANDASNVCQTAVATVEFNMAMDQTTVDDKSVKIFTCDSVSGNQCNKSVQVNPDSVDPDSYVLKFSNNDPKNQGNPFLSIALKDNNKLSPNTWYQVALDNSIKTKSVQDKYNKDIQFNLASTKACSNGSAYCFVFRTGSGDCKLKQVIVTPSQFWTNVLEKPIRYRTAGGDAYDVTYYGNGLSEQHCVMMNVSGFAWDWAPIDDGYTNRLSMFGQNNRQAQFGAKANTVGIGLKNNSVIITATAATTTGGVKISKSGDSALTIDLSNPKVVDYEPKCLEACTNALVSATFNVSMSAVNLDKAVKFYKCNDENCLFTEEVVGISPTIESKSVNDHLWLKIFNNAQGGKSLDPNTLYEVVLSAVLKPDVKVGCQGGSQLWSLANAANLMSCSKPFNQEFSWRFRTKKEACITDRVEVTPKVFTAQKLDDRAIFAGQPYSAPDACSANGQKLNPFKSDWGWSSSNLQVATIKSFTTKGNNPYCTSNCVLKGSDIASGGESAVYPVCGNDKIEAGEDCDGPDKIKNCSLKCLNTVKTKKGSQINTDSKDVNASICGNAMVGVDEDCDLGIAADSAVSNSAMFCGANCLHLGSPLSSAWCKKHQGPGDMGGFNKDEFTQACGQALSRCGDNVEDYNEDPGCDVGGGKHLDTCNDRCIKLSRCTPGPDNAGCSADGQLQGSSLLYPNPSVCGDGEVGSGEDAVCDVLKNFVGPIKDFVDPWVLAIGQGGGKPSGVPPVQVSNITGTTNNKSGVGKYEVQCGWKSDLECSSKYNDPNRGVGDDSCCYARSQLTKVYPGSVGAVANNICINTYIEADFDSVIDVNTLPGNLLLAKFNDTANICADGTDKVDDNLIANFGNLQNIAWYQKIWYKFVYFVKDIFGAKFAQANIWCAGADLASPYVVSDGNGGSKIILQLNKALAPGTKYAVIMKSGIKDTKGVRISDGPNNKPLGWQFVTGDKICEVSTVSVTPDHYSFNVANVSTTLTALAHTQNNQLIVSVPGYAWDYSWGPKVNDFVSVEDTTTTINNIISQNRNGEIDVYASAKIIDNKFTKQTGLVGTGRSHIIVFLCENPWPPLNQKVNDQGPFSIFPYEDKVNNNDNFDLAKNIFDNNSILSSELISNGYFNFSSYYCADSGASGNQADDLPYLKPAVQTAKDILGVVSADQGSCENDPNKFCSSDSDCALNQYNIYGHTFALSPTNPKICTVNFNGGSYTYYFDSDQASGQPLTCSVDSDCDPVKKSDFYVKTAAISSTCKSMANSKYNFLNIKCSKLVTAFSALKRFIFTNNKNGDAIGMQILSNPNHLTARQWFELDKKASGKGGQGFIAASGLQDLQVDGYDAVSDGNNVYVNALNFASTVPNSGYLYTNTYLFSINPDANQETRKVFDQIIKNLKFNINLTNDKRCVVPPNGPAADASACNSDFDCPTFGTCADAPHSIDVCSTDQKQLCSAATVAKCPLASKPVSCVPTNVNSSYCAHSLNTKCSTAADCPDVVTPPACVSISKDFKYCSNNTQQSCTGEIGKTDPGCTDGASTGTCEVLTAKVNACADNNNKPCFDLINPANNGCQPISNPDTCVVSTTISNVCANSGLACAGQGDLSCAPITSPASCVSASVVSKSCSNNPDQSCSANSDCITNQVCSAQKDKLQRDFERLQDMKQISDSLNNYKLAHGNTYPDLKAGTYLTGQTISTWPSWSVLGNAVGSSLPSDPINKLGVGGTCGSSTSSIGVFCVSDIDCLAQAPDDQKCVLHDPTTNWSTANQRFSFACAPDSLAFRYSATSTSSTIPGANNYKIKLNWEIIGIKNKGLDILNKSNLFNDFIPATDASKFDLNSDTGICNQSKEIASLVVGTCGDGKVGKNEDCDPPGGVKWNINDCDKKGVNSKLTGDICSVTCKWTPNATSTTCGTKLSKCGNGIVELDEKCDDGALNGKYGHCDGACTGFASTCGDGKVDPANEVCEIATDYYKDSLYPGYVNHTGWCSSGLRGPNPCATDEDCKIQPYDSNNFKSEALLGTQGKCVTLAMNNNRYGLELNKTCNSDCQKYGPYCGDGIIQTQFGEECDGNQGCSVNNDTGAAAGARVCGFNCRWNYLSATTSPILYYNFDDVVTFHNGWKPLGAQLDDKSFIGNKGYAKSGNSDLNGAYCFGTAVTGCPAPTPSVDPVKDQAMQFNGTSNYFVVDHYSNFDVNELTFATWINIDSSTPSGWNPIFTKSNHEDKRDHDHNRDYNFYFNKTASGTIDTLHMYSSYYPDENNLTIGNPPKANDTIIFGISGVDPKISAGEWHFIAITVNALRETRYYVDDKLLNPGNLAGTVFSNGSVNIKADHNYPLWIGRGDDGYFKGKMDELQLYGRALSEGEIKDLYKNSANFCQISAVSGALSPKGTCGDGKIDNGQNGTLDKGEVCDKGAQNGIPCESSYNKSCTYCAANCKNVVTVSAAGFCGDGIINGLEKCELDPKTGILFSSATSSGTYFGGLGTSPNKIPPYNGYAVIACESEFNTTLNASSSYWYSQVLKGNTGNPKPSDELIGKVGTKSCLANCSVGSNAPIQDNCVACGLTDKGATVSGAIINVLDPKNTNPLIAEAAAGNFVGHWGYIDLLYAKSNVAASGEISSYRVAYDSYDNKSGDYAVFKLHPGGDSKSLDAIIKSDPICSDKSQSRYYRLALNADWSNEHMIDFSVFGTSTPDTYNLLLSPVIAQADVKSSPVNTVGRSNDFRVVVSWVGKDINQFSAGLFDPTKPSAYIPNNENAVGTNYFSNLPNPASGIWFHGFGYNLDYNANEEAFTIDTSQMNTSSYAFFIKVNSLASNMTQAGKSAKLKVDIYAPEAQHAPAENTDVYRHFARPIKTFYFSQALPSFNPDAASYWHVFNILKVADPAVAEYGQHFFIGSQYNSIRTEIKFKY